MATPGASRQPLACTMLPHKKPTSLGALLRLAVAVVALYVPRAAPARRLRTSLHLRRAPRRAWTRRGAPPRFSRRMGNPNSLFFMAELTERCGVCAKCQWTCADQPDQRTAGSVETGVGRVNSNRASGVGPPALREAAAGGSPPSARRLRECQWTCADQPDSRAATLSKRRRCFQTGKRGSGTPALPTRAFTSRMEGVLTTEQDTTLNDEARAKAEAGGGRPSKRRSEIRQRTDAAKRDAETSTPTDAGGDGQQARGRPRRGRVGITARLRRLGRRRQADDRPVAGPRRLLLPRSRPRMHALDHAQNHFHGAFDDLCRRTMVPTHWLIWTQAGRQGPVLDDFLFVAFRFCQASRREDGSCDRHLREGQGVHLFVDGRRAVPRPGGGRGHRCAYGVPLLYNGQVVLLTARPSRAASTTGSISRS